MLFFNQHITLGKLNALLLGVAVTGLCWAGPVLAGESKKAKAPQWKVVTDQEGVVVSQKAVPGRSLPIFKGVTVIKADVFQILGVLQDVEKNPEWMHACVDAKRLKKFSDTEFLVYNRSGAPWPISDRDVVVRSKANIDRENQVLTITMRSTESDLMPPSGDAVRMPRLNGHFIFSEAGKGKTQIEYQIDADPGGLIPSWLATMASRDIPLRTLVNLRNRVKKTAKEGTYQAYIDSVTYLKESDTK
jgi:hypothetical protein